MSSFVNQSRASSLRSLWILAIIAAVSLPACSDEPQPEPTQTDTAAQPAASATTTAGPPATAAPTTPAPVTTVTATTTTIPPSEPIDQVVPAGAVPEIDGILEPDEWSNSVVLPMSDGALLHLQHNNEVLYVAVEEADVGSVNIIIATDSDVRILHSSAALGSARYLPGSSVWSLDHGFSWCCRRGSEDSARATLFAAEGWEANIGFAGDPGIVEYAVSLPWEDAAFAVSSIRSGGDTGFFPTDLTTEQQSELLGVPPPERVFSTDYWVRLRTTQ